MSLLLNFENLSRRFAGRWAVKGAAGAINEGDAIALSGPNGAGKSTLLYLLAGLMRSDCGLVTKHTTRLSLLSHVPMLYSRLTAWENLLFFLQIAGIPKNEAKKRASASLSYFSLKERRHERPENFSRGMLQRLLLARLAAEQPALVLFDEPFTGLDVTAQDLLSHLIENRGIPDLNWSFSAFLLVDHDVARLFEFTQSHWQMALGDLVTKV